MTTFHRRRFYYEPKHGSWHPPTSTIHIDLFYYVQHIAYLIQWKIRCKLQIINNTENDREC